jgi:hypothetical protein
MADDVSYAEWIKTDPPPDLQELVRRYGGYNKITPDACAVPLLLDRDESVRRK